MRPLESALRSICSRKLQSVKRLRRRRSTSCLSEDCLLLIWPVGHVSAELLSRRHFEHFGFPLTAFFFLAKNKTSSHTTFPRNNIHANVVAWKWLLLQIRGDTTGVPAGRRLLDSWPKPSLGTDNAEPPAAPGVGSLSDCWGEWGRTPSIHFTRRAENAAPQFFFPPSAQQRRRHAGQGGGAQHAVGFMKEEWLGVGGRSF